MYVAILAVTSHFRSADNPDSVNVYVILGPKAARLLRMSQADIEMGSVAEPVECTFPAPKVKKGKKKAEVDDENDDDDDNSGKPKKKATTSRKPKAAPKKKAKRPIDEEKDIPSDSDSENEDLLGLDSESDHGFDGIESSSDVEVGWKIGK
jgi:hypothetical protein